MSDPFRGETEQLRALLQRAEERAHALTEEKGDLQRQLDLRHSPRGPWIVALIAGLAAGTIGYGAGNAAASSSAARALALREREAAAELALERKQQMECLAAQAKATTGEQACLKRLEERAQVRAPSASCKCLPADPLCSCLGGPGLQKTFTIAAPASGQRID